MKNVIISKEAKLLCTICKSITATIDIATEQPVCSTECQTSYHKFIDDKISKMMEMMDKFDDNY